MGSGLLLKKLRCASKIGIEINPTARAYAETLGIDSVLSLDEICDESRWLH